MEYKDPIVIKARIVGEKVPELEGRIGKILNIFRNTVNIVTVSKKEELITVTTKNIFSPYNVNLELSEFLSKMGDFRSQIIPEDIIRISSKNLKFQKSKLIICITNSKIFSINKELENLRTTACNGLSLEELVRITKKFLKIANLLDKNISRKIYPYIAESSLLICDSIISSSKLGTHISDKALKYLGLGDGLTPAYDDFLGGLFGVISILFSLENNIHAIQINRSLLNKTTPISKYLLLQLIEGDANNLVLGLVKSYCAHNEKTLLNELIDLLQLGHSSGTYMGIGALTALTIHSLFFNKKAHSKGRFKELLKALVDNT